jgi:hypothetical protein
VTGRLEQAIVNLNRARVRAAICRMPRVCEFIDEAIRQVEAEIVEQELVGTQLEYADFAAAPVDVDAEPWYGKPGAETPEDPSANERAEV